MQTWGLHHLVEVAELIVSELVTNAVKATGCAGPGPRHVDLHDIALVEVRLQVNIHVFRIAVQDGSTKWPEMQTVNEEAENGRGLFLVDALSSRWDVEPCGSEGKVTWVELNIPVGEHS